MALQQLSLYIGYVPTIIFGFLIVMALYIMFLKGTSVKKIREDLSIANEADYNTDRMLNQAGIQLNTAQTKAVLYTLAFMIGVFALFYAIYYSNMGYFLLGLLAAVLVIVLLSPSEEIATGIPSPFKLITRKIMESRGKALDEEVFNSCITLKNLAIVKQESPMSADVLFEQLMENANKLKPIYAEMLSIYRTGDSERAFKVFADSIGTKFGKSFASVLSRVDLINPYELKEQVVVLQELMSETRLSIGVKKAERNGVITIGFATGTFFAELMNFAFVVVMMDALSMINGIFN